jgi:tRNA (cmo5U34)-methyltransferase
VILHASDAFDEYADTYDLLRRQLVPPFERFYAAAVDTLELSAAPVKRVLDLGAGTGLLARRVRERYPAAELTLLDGSAAMLAEARSALGPEPTYVKADLRDPLPPGPWDAVVSALAIHHLDDPGKQRLFENIHHALTPGGVFVNAEQVAGPTPLFDELYRAWHERSAKALGVSDNDWRDAEKRMQLDQCSSVEHQLSALRAAGFADADCIFKEHRFAVIVARRS